MSNSNIKKREKMKNIVLIALVIILTNCSNNKDNYSMISKMNKSHPIEIIYYDSKTADKLGSFPIDRKYYADLIESIEESKPKIVILKFFMDRTSSSDEYLHNVLSKYDNIFTQTTSFLVPDELINKNKIKKYALKNYENTSINSNDTILLPNKNLIDDFAGIGFTDIISENDMYLDNPLVSKVEDLYFPSLALKIAMFLSGSEPTYKNGFTYLNNKKIKIVCCR